jgi:hypothetical protein
MRRSTVLIFTIPFGLTGIEYSFSRQHKTSLERLAVNIHLLEPSVGNKEKELKTLASGLPAINLLKLVILLYTRYEELHAF